VFEDVFTDLFQSGQLHVLVYAERLSGWLVIHRGRHDPSAREIVQTIVENFVDLGVSVRLQSDGGPQFDLGAFQSTLKRWGVVWSNSTPYYPQSNGHVEAAVSAIKELVEKSPHRATDLPRSFFKVCLNFVTPHEQTEYHRPRWFLAIKLGRLSQPIKRHLPTNGKP
jgi:transposase InsO family protein